MSFRLFTAMSCVVVAMLASGTLQGHAWQEDRAVAFAPPAARRGAVTVIAPRPPPSPMPERVQPRPGYLWAHGYWRWNGRDYVTVPGHWEPVRAGYRYLKPHWERRADGWHWRAGVWVAG